MIFNRINAPVAPAFRRILLGLTSASLLFSTTLTPLWAQDGRPGIPPGVASGQHTNAYSQEELDAILAPIALYPDQLLTQVLMATVFPDQVGAAAQWVASGGNRNLRGEVLERALAPVPWDPSVKSLVPFPQILEMLSSHQDWAAQLAYAVAEQEAATFDSIQRLRRQARIAGHLRSTNQQIVRMDGELIIILPVRNVVYVPVYNPQVVYGNWAYPTYPPYYFPPLYPVPSHLLSSGIYFGTGIVVVGTLWGWATPRWHDRRFHVDSRRYDYFRQNYRAPPGDWRRWDRDQWRPPTRQMEGQVRPMPPRPTDDRYRPPIQRPGEGPSRPAQGRPGDGDARPMPRPGDGQSRPMPPRPGDGDARPMPGRPGDGQSRPMPRPGDGDARPMPGRPGEGQMRPVPDRPVDGQVRPMPPRPGDGDARPMPGGQRGPDQPRREN